LEWKRELRPREAAEHDTPDPYPCYPFNPWFFSDFQKIGVSFAAKE
jgi:hypothetical protein